MIFRFGEFELDESKALLRRAGHPISLQPKSLEVLLFLIRARDRIAPIAEILESLWVGTAVSVHSVVRAVSGARAAIGDDARQAQYIQTIRGKGYRFTANVEVVASAPREGVSPAGNLDGADVFVGREPLLASLRAELLRVLAGETRIVVLEGEAGIGKTRTATEVCTLAQTLGAQVYTGWCQEGEATSPFQPWRQILRELMKGRWQDVLERNHPSAAQDVRALLSGAESAPVIEAQEVVPGEARLRMFEAIASLLRAAAGIGPLLLMIDDLHAADVASLRLLEFLARELQRIPVGIVTTLRSEEVPLQHPAVRTLSELARRGSTVRLGLTNMNRGEVSRCIAAWTGHEPERARLDEVFGRSEGNPFFVRELTLWLAQAYVPREPSGVTRQRVPPNVRDVVRRRLQSRSDPCLSLLRAASVTGRDLDLEVLQQASELSEQDVVAALEEALAARLVIEDPPESGHHRFAHGLIQETLLHEQSRPRVAAMHRAVAQAIARIDGPSDARLAERARHACDGADAATAEAATACAVRAAEQALSVMAYEDAAQAYRRALAALSVAREEEPVRRCDLLLDLGRALSHAGEPHAAETAFLEATALSDRLADTRRRVRAALGLLGGLPTLAAPSAERIRVAEEAAAALGPQDDALHVTALGRIGLAWSTAGEVEHGVEIAEAAVAKARQLGDRHLLAGALNLRTTVSLPTESPHVRLGRVEESLRAMGSEQDVRTQLDARIQRASALLELGRVAEMRGEIDAYARLAEELRHPVPRWYAQVQRALCCLLAGEFADAEAATLQAFETGRRAGHPDALAYFAIQMTQLRYFQGRLGEMEEPLRRVVQQSPGLLGLRCALALVLAETNRPDDARLEVAAVAANDFSGLRRDAGWLSNLSVLALVVPTLRDAELAERLHAAILPYQDRNVCAFLVTSNGAAAHFLALLAAVSGHPHQAVAHAERAVAANERMEIAPWTAASQIVLADALFTAGAAPGDGRVVELAEAGLSAAERMHMPPLAKAARRTLLRVGDPDRSHLDRAVQQITPRDD